MGEGVRLALVDDHTLVREALVHLLAAVRPEHPVVYSGDDPREALAQAPEVVLLDLDLGRGAEPSSTIAALVAAGPRVLVVSATTSPDVVRASFHAGAAGYVLKQEPADSLLESLDRVIDGDAWMSPQIAGVVLDDDNAARPLLSPQERRALILYSTGQKLDGVARGMNVAPSTVKQYLDRAKAKYAAVGRPVRTKTDLYRAAVQDGFVTVDPPADR